jgi:hypothetical protein
MKLSKEELAERSTKRRQGYDVNNTEKDNRETWKRWQGYARFREYQEQKGDKKLFVSIGAEVGTLPQRESLEVDLTACVVPNPNAITDNRKRLLAKWRLGLKELGEAGIMPMDLYNEAPKHDPKKNLRVLSSVVFEELGKFKKGRQDMVDAVLKACRVLGEQDFNELDGEVKERILLGSLVHPLALKPIHLQKLNGNQP